MATYPSQMPPPVDADPFGDFESVPSLSFAEAQVGTVYQGIVSKLPRLVQDRDIETKKPKFWEDGSPQLSVVLHIDVALADGTVETRGVWAKKPSSMYRAIGQAQKDAGAQISIGGTLAIRFAGTQPAKTKGFHPQKLYEARYTPPVNVDPWASTTLQSAGAAPAAPPAAPAQPSPVGWPGNTPAKPAPTAAPAQPSTPTW